MKMTSNTRRGFTLIELLIVVLIIGILAAVAVPQYQKVVIKSRLMKVMTSINTLQKALDLYVLTNGLPEEVTRFWGENAKVGLDVDLNCSGIVYGDSCLTDSGSWSVACAPGRCFIDLNGGDGKELADIGHVAVRAENIGVWKLYRVPTNTMAKKVVCQWWVEHYGIDSFDEHGYGNPAELCAEVGVQ